MDHVIGEVVGDLFGKGVESDDEDVEAMEAMLFGMADEMPTKSHADAASQGSGTTDSPTPIVDGCEPKDGIASSTPEKSPQAPEEHASSGSQLLERSTYLSPEKDPQLTLELLELPHKVQRLSSALDKVNADLKRTQDELATVLDLEEEAQAAAAEWRGKATAAAEDAAAARAKLEELAAEFEAYKRSSTQKQQQGRTSSLTGVSQAQVSALNARVRKMRDHHGRLRSEATVELREFAQLLSGVADRVAGAARAAAAQPARESGRLHELQAHIEKLAGEAERERLQKAAIAERFRAQHLERKALHNRLQEMRGNVRVLCRVRPPLEGEVDRVGGHAAVEVGCVEDQTADTITVRDLRSKRPTRYRFNTVLGPESTQSDVFAEVAPLATSVVDGYNACIFAYGQTGSGKTHTMAGPRTAPGVYARIVREMFHVMKSRIADFRFRVVTTGLEIYNEEMRDLLKPSGTAEGATEGDKPLTLRNTTKGVSVQGITEIEVRSAAEVDELLQRLNERRAVGSTDANERSSRSHSILTLTVRSQSRTSDLRTKAVLHCVDLAGSERLSHSHAEGERRVEASAINKSLSALGQVFAAIGSKSKHVPYRNSKLTHVLKDALGGDAKALMIVCASPTAASASETNCSLAFATRVNAVERGRATLQLDDENFEGSTRGGSRPHGKGSGKGKRARKSSSDSSSTNQGSALLAKSVAAAVGGSAEEHDMMFDVSLPLSPIPPADDATETETAAQRPK